MLSMLMIKKEIRLIAKLGICSFRAGRDDLVWLYYDLSRRTPIHTIGKDGEINLTITLRINLNNMLNENVAGFQYSTTECKLYFNTQQ